MELEIRSTTNTAKGKKKLPTQFTELVRPDLVKRAVEVVQSNKRQPYGANPDAGMRHSAELSRRRSNYRGAYGFGISRVQRKILMRRGRRMYWVGAVVPGTVGGRRAHPPKADKKWNRKINTKERRKAIRSALAAVMHDGIVAERGHQLPKGYPFLVEQKLESIKTTKEAKQALEKLGFGEELARAARKKVRRGKGKARNRRYKRKTGLLLVVSDECPLSRAARNIPGVDIVPVHRLNAELLAPGSQIGRITLFTEAAVDRLDKEGLFTKDYKPAEAQKESPKKGRKSTKQKPAQKKRAKKAEQ